MVDLSAHPLLAQGAALASMIEQFPASDHQTRCALAATALLEAMAEVLAPAAPGGGTADPLRDFLLAVAERFDENVEDHEMADEARRFAAAVPPAAAQPPAERAARIDMARMGDPGRGTFEAGATCWVCPDCAFAFDAQHTDQDANTYTCPLCRPSDGSNQHDWECATMTDKAAVCDCHRAAPAAPADAPPSERRLLTSEAHWHAEAHRWQGNAEAYLARCERAEAALREAAGLVCSGFECGGLSVAQCAKIAKMLDRALSGARPGEGR